MKEYILCAANYYNDGVVRVHKPKNIETGFVVCGRRHHNCISTFAQIVGFPYTEQAHELHRTEIQGFLTNEDRFVDREEAYRIAVSKGQVMKDSSSGKTELYSEDIC